MSSIEDMINNSKCFGLAYDKSVTECKICEVRTRCESKCYSIREIVRKPEPVNVVTPDTNDISHTQEHTSSKIMKFPTATPEVQNTKSEDLPCEVKHSLPSNPDSISEPSQPQETPKKEKKKRKPTKDLPEPNYSPDMPKFKGYTIEEIEQLAESRGINPIEFDKYNSLNIRRMRMIMAIKQTYEI